MTRMNLAICFTVDVTNIFLMKNFATLPRLVRLRSCAWVPAQAHSTSEPCLPAGRYTGMCDVSANADNEIIPKNTTIAIIGIMFDMYIKIRVKTGQKKESVVKKSDTEFVVSVRQKPERNLANRRIIELFQALYTTNNVRIISGIHHPIKMVSIEV